MNTHGLQIMKRSWDMIKEQNRQLTGFRFIILGGTIGSVQGGYSAFQVSKHDDIMSNFTVTTAGAAFGGSIGVLLGIVWPIAVPFFCMRLYDRGITSSFCYKRGK
jgi:hypothetical protein